MNFKKPFPAALLALGTTGALAFTYGSCIERKNYQLRQVNIPALPPESDPVRILHISDLHMANWQTHKQRWISHLIDYDPHLIINTGDTIGHPDFSDGLSQALDVFASVPGAFVFGSHDYFKSRFKNPFGYFSSSSKRTQHLESSRVNTALLTEYLCSLGWTDLNNNATTLKVGQTTFELFGVDDPHTSYDRMDLLPTAIERVRESNTYTASATPVISLGVVHSPYQRILDAFVTYGANIIFAGHTHGGQVRIPGVGALIANCDIPRQQTRGLSTWSRSFRSSYLNVSAGLGTSIYAPIRFACPPEATLLTLTPSKILESSS